MSGFKAYQVLCDSVNAETASHSMRVADNFRYAANASLSIVARLHDVFEDRYKGNVDAGIIDLHHTHGLSVNNTELEALKAITRQPGEDYLASYIPRVAANPIALEVKLADLEDNMSFDRQAPFSEDEESRFQRYAKAWFYLQRRKRASHD